MSIDTEHSFRNTSDFQRPVSEIFPRRHLNANTHSIASVNIGNSRTESEIDSMSLLADQWVSELDDYQGSLDAIASPSATFKSELNSIETWFLNILTEPERTAALYTLLQHTTQVQIRFFMTVLKEMEVKRLDPAMARVLDSDSKAGVKRTQKQPNLDAKRASLARDDEEILVDAPDMSGRAISPIGSEKSASRPPSVDLEIDSPLKASIAPSWETPSKPMANTSRQWETLTPANSGWGNMMKLDSQSSLANAEIMATSTAMKLAALSTVNNRIILDTDVRKFRRRNLLEQTSSPLSSFGSSSPAVASTMMYNEVGQVVPVPSHLGSASSPFVTRGRRTWQSTASTLFSSPASYLDNQLPSTPAKSFSPETGFQFPGLGMGLGLGSSPFSDWYSSPMSAPAKQSVSMSQQTQRSRTAASPAPSSSSTTSSGSSSTRQKSSSTRESGKESTELPDETQLNDIPSWLRSLRLHKYTDNLKGLSWEELVQLSEDQLIARGVSALGARRKMLKVFETVKKSKRDLTNAEDNEL
ncbi:hypothetical protein V1512DRAFT_264053 [Lipomyces arxii]|uniref:uncharacterized protein n=1 Tax=Lipomyces arxii TaxID=56418 RepID=UPI0034CD9F42